MNRRSLLAAAVLVLGARTLAAQAPRLGTITFPTSAGPAAQADFVQGVLYLHSFEYDAAARAFRRAQERDSGFALAYWGEAMTHNHGLWDEQNLESARAILARLAPTTAARAARAPTARERAWLGAAEALYGEGTKPRRDTLYARAMEQVLAAFPDDESRTFYALALIGQSQATRNVPTYMRAGALAAEVQRTSPDHPGAAHYVIHAFDDPVHAPLGLHAARAYSRIAPDAAHAQHMTTHIFVALGMWDEAVAQNEVAVRATARAPGHYTYWLLYGEIQRGHFAAARALLDSVARNLNPVRPGHAAHLTAMRAQYLLNTEEWSGAVARMDWPVRDWSYAPLGAWTRGYAAWRRGDRAAHAAALTAVEAAPAGDPVTARKRDILVAQLRGLAAVTWGDPAAGTALLRVAAASEDSLPMEYGPPDVPRPSWELLGEVLLESDAAGAQQAFARALELAPGRARSLAGFVRAAALAGDHAAARRAFDVLAANLREADREVTWLRDVAMLVAGR